MPSVYYNRIPEISLREEIRALDPNHRAPLTRAEYASLSASDRKSIDELLARVTVPLGLQNNDVDRSGRSPLNTYINNLGSGDDRGHTRISTTVSEHNAVEPLFSNAVVPNGPNNFDERLAELIDGARKFIFIEGFQLGREDLVDRLIERAREGVQVVVLFDPANEDSEAEKKRLLKKLRDAARNDSSIKRHGSLHVAEYKVIPHGGGYGFEQILHVKKVIADRPYNSIAEISGGVNFGANSHNNYDTAWYTEGVSVLDSLNRLVRHYPAAADGSRPFDLSMIPTAARVRSALKRRGLTGRDLTTIEIAGSGKARPEKPRKYTTEELQEAARIGKKIVISARDVIEAGVEEVLLQALKNGSWVRIIEPKLSAAQEAKLKPIAKRLRASGAGVYKADATLNEESYAALVYRELDRAIADGESIDVAAFCLTDDGVIQRLIRAKEAGCQVRVLLDDLNLYGMLINRKAIALLTAAKIDVRMFENATAQRLAPEGATETKLHTKLITIGGKRVLGGSANFTRNGFSNNIEDGRLVRSRAVATAYRDQLFNPLWEVCPKAHPMRTVRESDRISLIDRVPMETPIRDLVFLVCDTETTGFSPAHDERILQIALKAVRIRNGEMEVLEEYDAYIDPGNDATGSPFAIPYMATRVHGLDAAALAEKGARDIREVLPEVVDFVKRQKQHGEVVTAGQNTAFDMRFIDFALSRRSIATLDGIDKLSLDGPFVDVADVSAKLFPRSPGNDLDSLLKRLHLRRRRKEFHDAIDDVDLTAKILARLLEKGGRELRTLGDLMGGDLLSIDEGPVFLSETSDGPRAFRLEEPVDGYLFLRTKEENGRYGEPERVRDIDVLDVDLDGDRLYVAIETGSSSNPTRVTGYVAPKDVRFHAPGPAYHRLRAAGYSLPKPYVLKRR